MVGYEAIRHRSHRGYGGYSQGTADAWKIVFMNPRNVEQLYWLDPIPDTVRTLESALLSWLLGDVARQLRLVGGIHHSPRPGKPDQYYTLWPLLERLRRVVTPPDRVSLVPEDVAAYSGLTYSSAIACAPQSGLLTVPERFHRSSETATSAGELSFDTGAYVEATAPRLVLEGRKPGDGPLPPARRDLAAVYSTEAEAAGVLRFFYRNTLHGAALHSKETRPRLEGEVALDLEHWVAEVRHQWAACGGDGDPFRGAAFVGYLHDCIRRGGF